MSRERERANNENKVSGLRGIKGIRAANERESTGAVAAKNTNDKIKKERERHAKNKLNKRRKYGPSPGFRDFEELHFERRECFSKSHGNEISSRFSLRVYGRC